MAKTLTQLIERIRRKSDQENSSFVSDDEIRDDLNFSIGELYDIILSSYNFEYFVDGYAITTVVGQTDYDLPTDFYKLAGLDISSGGSTFSVDKYNFSERNIQKNSGQYSKYDCPFKYRIYNSSLRLLPAPTSAYSLTMHYIPQITELVLGTDTVGVNIVESWLEYAIVDTAIKIMIKEESDPGALMAQKQSLGQRIMAMKENRDAANPEVVKDVYAIEDEYGIIY